MSANFFLKSIAFANYRGLRSLDVKAFRRINVIGGFNGVGKSTLLEAIFFLFDRRGPAALTRPYMWRKVGMAGRASLDQYFSDQDHNKAISITAGTSVGRLVISMAFEPTPPGVTVQVPSGPMGKLGDLQQSVSSEIGLNVQSAVDGQPDDAFFVLPTSDGFTINPYRRGRSKIPQAVIVTPQTRNSPQEDAERFSVVVKDRRLAELLQILSIINPQVNGIQLLQEGNIATLHAQFQDGTLHPFPMLGDGLQTLLSIALAIMTSSGGAVLLDEFDSAIHYSVLADTWSRITTLANRYNCQIFAVTHSLECIKAALEGVTKGSRVEDFMYLRLERSESGIASVPFDGQELKESLNADWEIR